MLTTGESLSMAKELHGVYLAWTKKFIAFNSWRIEGDFDDCLQEAQIKFIQCQAKYGDVEAPHLMSLFQRAVVRHFHTLSNKRSKFLSIRRDYRQELLPPRQTVDKQFIGEFAGIYGSMPTELLEISSLFRFINRMELLLMNIKKELAEACGNNGDDLNALLEAANTMSDEVYDRLSKDAKDWLDKAVDAANDGQDLPPLNGAETTKERISPSKTKKRGNDKNKVGRQSRYDDNDTIKVLVNRNPKRRNSKAHEIFYLYKDGMTVKEFLEAGGQRRDLNWNVAKNFMKVIPCDVSE